jgi:uncharacterized membrane protein YdjX (TVP38/TMEM64 family)
MLDKGIQGACIGGASKLYHFYSLLDCATCQAMSLDGKSIAEAKLTTVEPANSEAEIKPPLRKALLLTVWLGLLLLIVYLSPLRHYLEHVKEVSDGIRQMGYLAPLVTTFGVALLVAVGFPRLIFCVISGMALGFWQGLLWAQLGTLAGNYLLFLLIRAGGGDWGKRYLSRHGGFKFTHTEGIATVILARQLPVPGLIVNLGLGLSGLKHRHFLIGTALGQLPEAIPCTLIGAGAIQSSFTQSAGMVGLAVLVLALMWIGLRLAMRRLTAWRAEIKTPMPTKNQGQ